MKVFDGFQLDLAEELSGLSRQRINWLRENGIVEPEKVAGGFKYTFQDLLMFKLVRVLEMNKVKIRNIERAAKFLEEFDLSKKLTGVKLYIRDDTRQILYVGEDPQKDQFVMMDGGQFVHAKLLTILPVGKHLEQMRQNVLSFDKELDKSLHSRKTIPLGKLLKQYGVS